MKSTTNEIWVWCNSESKSTPCFMSLDMPEYDIDWWRTGKKTIYICLELAAKMLGISVDEMLKLTHPVAVKCTMEFVMVDA